MPRVQITQHNGEVEEHSYIVKLKEGTDKQAHLEHVSTHFAHLHGHSQVTHDEWHSEVFHGYAGKFSGASLEALLNHDDVHYVEENGVNKVQAIHHQRNAPWGLARITRNHKVAGDENGLNHTYSYDSSAGEGVDVYVLDTGVYTHHNDFEGRATWGKTFIGTHNVDKHGHGTHCAGTVAGKQFGAAKLSKLIAVKVLGDNGHGTKASCISGLNWVKHRVHQTRRPSVISMSIGGAYSRAENDTVASVTAAGIHVVVAAGNENTDSKHKSPASAPTALTVGNSDIHDHRRHTSNYGHCVDVFAPGTHIISCGTSGRNATAVKTGTSMATPLVAGLVAYLIAKDGNTRPAAMVKKIRAMSVKKVLTGIPTGTVNYLARNDV